MSKFIQLVVSRDPTNASTDDMFALDDEGQVWVWDKRDVMWLKINMTKEDEPTTNQHRGE